MPDQKQNTMKDLTDFELAQLGANGSDDAYIELIIRHHKLLRFFAFQCEEKTKDRDAVFTSDDYYNVGTTKIWANLKNFRGESFKSWSGTIFENIANDRLREISKRKTETTDRISPKTGKPIRTSKYEVGFREVDIDKIPKIRRMPHIPNEDQRFGWLEEIVEEYVKRNGLEGQQSADFVLWKLGHKFSESEIEAMKKKAKGRAKTIIEHDTAGMRMIYDKQKQGQRIMP
jgi:DNA-directed RNA polymerase specialized sigma24 family protein